MPLGQPTRLVNLKINEVSGVDKAANQKQFLVIKSASGQPIEPPKQEDPKPAGVFKSLIQKLMAKPDGARTFMQSYAYEVMDDLLSDQMYNTYYALKDSIKSILGDPSVTDKVGMIDQTLGQFTEVVRGSITNALTMAGQVPVAKEEGKEMPINEQILKSLPQEVQDHIAGLEQQVAKAAPAPAPVAEPAAASPEELLKSLDPKVAEFVKSALTKAEQAETKLNDFVQKQFEATMVAKAASFAAIPGDQAELVKVLKAAYAQSEEAGQHLENILKATNDSILKGTLLKEQGSSAGQGGSDAWTKLEAAANDIQKADATLTKEQAITKAMETNPELYKAYREEQGGNE